MLETLWLTQLCLILFFFELSLHIPLSFLFFLSLSFTFTLFAQNSVEIECSALEPCKMINAFLGVSCSRHFLTLKQRKIEIRPNRKWVFSVLFLSPSRLSKHEKIRIQKWTWANRYVKHHRETENRKQINITNRQECTLKMYFFHCALHVRFPN